MYVHMYVCMYVCFLDMYMHMYTSHRYTPPILSLRGGSRQSSSSASGHPLQVLDRTAIRRESWKRTRSKYVKSGKHKMTGIIMIELIDY